MQLRRLKLRNIRSYVSADLELGPGTTLISGDVGTGKTSLLHSVEMALFGFAAVEPTFLIRHGATESEVALTLADGEHTYELVRRFRRRLRKGRDVFEPQENSFAEDGRRALYSATELRQRSIDLLGFPDNPNPRAHSDLWRWAVYVPQERMREILEQEPEERLETVRKALGLERYRTAAENAGLLATELRRRAESRTDEADRLVHFESDLALRTTELEGLASTLTDALAAESAARVELVGAESAWSAAEEALRRLESDRTELDRLSLERSSLEADRERLARRRAETERQWAAFVDQSRELENRQSELASTIHEQGTTSTELAKVRQTVEHLEQLRGAAEVAASEHAAALRAKDEGTARLRRAEEDEARERRALDAVNSEGPLKEPPPPTPRTLEAIDAARTQGLGERESAATVLARDRLQLAEIDALLEQGVCPTCHQTVDRTTHRLHREHAAATVEAGTGRLGEIDDRLRRTEEERKSRERFERAHLKWEETEKRRELARSSLGVAEERLREERTRFGTLVQAEVDAAGREAALRPQLESYPRVRAAIELNERTLADLENRRRGLERQVEAARSAGGSAQLLADQIAGIDADRERQTQRATEIDGAIAAIAPRIRRASELADLRTSTRMARDRGQALVERWVAERTRLTAQREAATSRRTEAERGVEERRQLQAEVRRLAELAEWCAGPFKTALLTIERRLLGRAQAEFDHHLRRFFGALIEDPSLTARCDASFSPSVEIDGEWTPPEALSGGERTALALAFRLALGDVVRTAGRLRLETLILDEPTDGFSPEQVVRMGELLSELAIPQVVLVSHETQLAGAADRVIRVEKISGRSQLVSNPAAAGAAAPPSPGGRPRSTPTFPVRKRRRTPRLDDAPVPQ